MVVLIFMKKDTVFFKFIEHDSRCSIFEEKDVSKRVKQLIFVAAIEIPSILFVPTLRWSNVLWGLTPILATLKNSC